MQHLNLLAYQEWLHNLPDCELLVQLKIEFSYLPYPPPEVCDGLEAVLEECDKRHLDVSTLFREWMAKKPPKKMARSRRPVKRCDWFGWKTFRVMPTDPTYAAAGWRGWLVFVNRTTKRQLPVAQTDSGFNRVFLRSSN